MLTVLAGLAWNPTVRGLLFPGIMAVILCGSTYLILATNMGNRLGFLVSATMLTGWLALMAVIWMIYGIGMHGTAAHWKVQEYISGPTTAAQYPRAEKLTTSNGWKLLKEGNPVRGDAQATADALLLEQKVFQSSSDYVPLTNAYEYGGEHHLFNVIKGEACTWEFVKRLCINHKAHWVVVQVQAAKKTTESVLVSGQETQRAVLARGSDGKVLRDTTQPVVTVVMVRDLGSLRRPGLVLFLASSVLFALCASTLHSRDKKVMALKAA